MTTYRIMGLNYVAMIGIPVLLWLVVFMSFVHGTLVARDVLEVLIGLGALLFGSLGVKELYARGGSRR
ncbi:MAG: hypothetical protein QW767_05155 [Thermoprotei archaeon]